MKASEKETHRLTNTCNSHGQWLKQSGEHAMCLRICPLFLFISYGQISAVLDKNVEPASFVAVADVQKDFPADLHVAIVSCLTVNTHHAVQAGLESTRWKEASRVMLVISAQKLPPPIQLQLPLFISKQGRLLWRKKAKDGLFFWCCIKSKPEKGQSLGPLVRKAGHSLRGDALPFSVSE